MSDLISRQAAIDALWKALYDYEDKTEKQFIESDELDINDWIQHRIFVQNMSDIDRQTIQNLPTIDAVPLEDYRSMEQTVHKLTQAIAEAEPQRAYEQGVKDTLDKYDEDFRIASEVRIAVGCKTAKECWELARNGDIQVVKHGRWIDKDGNFECSHCGNLELLMSSYCRRCGAIMDEVEE